RVAGRVVAFFARFTAGAFDTFFAAFLTVRFAVERLDAALFAVFFTRDFVVLVVAMVAGVTRLAVMQTALSIALRSSLALGLRRAGGFAQALRFVGRSERVSFGIERVGLLVENLQPLALGLLLDRGQLLLGD